MASSFRYVILTSLHDDPKATDGPMSAVSLTKELTNFHVGCETLRLKKKVTGIIKVICVQRKNLFCPGNELVTAAPR